MPLGSLLGPLEALLGCLWTPKTLKNRMFFKVFEDAAFWLFGALDGPIGLILLLLGQIWSQNGVPKWVSKVVLKDIKIMILTGFNDFDIQSKMGNCFFLFGAVFESILGSILIPKLVQNLLIFGSILDPFSLGFRNSLGASWEPSWAS